MTSYSSDHPITNLKHDKFLRSDYAKRIAGILVGKEIRESFVIGLYAPWGYGKTSTLKMIEKRVGKSGVVIRFNPWIYNGQNETVVGLLRELAARLDDLGGKQPSFLQKQKDRITHHGTSTVFDSAGELINKYAGAVGAFNESVEKGGTAIKALLPQSSLADIRAKLEKKIKASGKRVIVMIDDVDRLDKEEVFQLFKLIKIIADFKGVTYLVAFDDVAVAKALSERFAGGKDGRAGQDFIEKIIQIPLHLPLIERDVLDELLLSSIDEIIRHSRLPVSFEDTRRFRDIYDRHIAHLVKTPRAVKRYLNSLRFTLPLVGSEVNIGDLLIIEGVRIFYPHAYNDLRTQKLLLTGTRYGMYIEREDRKEKAKNEVMTLLGEDEGLIQIVRQLFPYVDGLFSSASGTHSQQDLRAARRVASVDYFDRYFTYGVGASDISDERIVAILQEGAPEQIADGLQKMFEQSKSHLVMGKIKTYSENVDKPVNLAEALIILVDRFGAKESSFLGDSSMDELARLIEMVLSRSSRRLQDYKRITSKCANLDQLTFIVRNVILGSEEEKSRPILSSQGLDGFKSHIVSKIKKIVKQRPLHYNDFTIAHVSHHLYKYWADFAGREEVNKYLQSVLKDYDSILTFLTHHLAVWSGTNGTHRGNLDQATYKSILQVVDAEPLYKILVSSKKELKSVSEYPELEDSDKVIGRAGDEKDEAFRGTLARQFIYLFEQSKSKKEEVTT